MGKQSIQYQKIFANYEEQENFVGIAGYTTTTPPIGGKIKQAISDFIVREITPSGEILSTFEENNPDIPYREKYDRATLFTLIKMNTDTILAAEIVQKYLKIPQNHIKWAGIKDHTAITAQKCSVKGNWVEKLKKFKHNDIKISNIRPAHHEIDIGQLWGNHFSINIRSTSDEYEAIKPVLDLWEKEVNEKGFPNFYGMQRFGKHRPNSHLVGKAIFEQDYQTAVEEFLFAVYPNEYSQIAHFRTRINESRDFQAAVKECPGGLSYERLMFRHLAEEPTDWKGAIKNLPPALLNLVMSAYQSYLFNKVVSKRIISNQPIHLPINGDVISILKEERGHPSLVFYRYHGGEGWNDPNILKAFKHDRAAVVAPVVGYGTDLQNYPAFADEYHQLLKEECFDIGNYKHNDKRLLNFEGTFRAINRRPRGLEITPAHIPNQYPKIDPYGIKMDFSLPKGTYATMLLRELRKL